MGRMSGKTIFSFLPRAAAEYLYPARCVCCRKSKPKGKPTAEYILLDDPDAELRQIFCDSCAEDFKKSCDTVCRRCGKRAYACECAPDALRAAGIRRAFACFTYEKGHRDSAASQFIYSLKGTENRDSVNFAAHLLSRRIAISGVFGDALTDVVLTFAPRGAKNIRRYGGDHMKAITELTAKYCGCAFADVFANIARGEQKKRGLYEREHSASESIMLKDGAALAGKNVIILDDIITSGATLGACVTLAHDAGAAQIAVFALAKTGRRSPRGEDAGGEIAK